VKRGVDRERKDPPLTPLLRWSGMALIVGGLLTVVATALHPSRETTISILQTEPRLVAAHALFTLAYLLVLLGLPGLYAAQSAMIGRLGLSGFLLAFTGTTLVAVSGDFGFMAPVLAESPERIDAVNRYPPVVILNAVAFATFVLGFVLFGIAMTKTARLPHSPGILIATGAPTNVLGFATAYLVSSALWTIAVIGSAALGGGLAWAGYRMWRQRAS
jgi:hypothetical protein